MQENASFEKDDKSFKTIFIAVSIGMFLVPLMVSAVGAILPLMGQELNASAGSLGMVSATYTLTLSIFNLVAGRISEILGRRKIFLIGLSVFLLTTVCLSMVPNISSVIVLRIIQGIGAAMVNTCASSILIGSAPIDMRGRIMGTTSSMAFFGVALGPLIGGFVADLLGWRWLYIILVPPGLLVWFLIKKYLKTEWQNAKGEPFDFRGSFIMGLSLCLITFAASFSNLFTLAPLMIIAGIVGLTFFCYMQLHTKYPVLDVRFLINHKSMTLSLIVVMLNSFATAAVVYYFMLYLQQVRMINPFHAGMFTAVQCVVQMILAPFVGRAADKKDPDYFAFAGQFIIACPLLFLALFVSVDTPLWVIAIIQVFLGLGMALFMGPNTLSIFACVDQKHMGEASGLSSTMRTLGMLGGLVLASSTMTRYLGDSQVSLATVEPFLQGMRFDFFIFCFACILGIIIGMLNKKLYGDNTCS